MAQIRMSLEASADIGFLEMEIPIEWYSKTFEELFLFISTQKSRLPINDSESGLSVIYNLDTSEIYKAFTDIFNSWSRGLCNLSIDTGDYNNVPIVTPINDILLSPVSVNESIILKQTFDPLEWYRSENEDFDQLMEWLKISTLLYVIDKKLDESNPNWYKSITSLMNDIHPNEVTIKTQQGKLEITTTGRQLLGSMIEETESYIEAYDIFKDVIYDPEMLSARFGTGHGDDLRVQVYESEGLNSVRTVFMLMLYDGTLELALTSMTDFSLSTIFFNNLLVPVLDRVIVEDSDIDWIIEAGFEYSAPIGHNWNSINQKPNMLNTRDLDPG